MFLKKSNSTTYYLGHIYMYIYNYNINKEIIDIEVGIMVNALNGSK
jgi:hypothetical protein